MDYHFVEAIAGDLRMEASAPGSSENRSRPIRVVLAVALAIAPFGAALIRFTQTGTDVRYFWVALAAFLGPLVVLSIGRARTQRKDAVLRLAGIAFLVSTLLAVLAARLLGASATFGIWAVAIVYALFTTAGQVLFSLSRPRQS
jgi:O-antigen/teichoic acid export membrane protein